MLVHVVPDAVPLLTSRATTPSVARSPAAPDSYPLLSPAFAHAQLSGTVSSAEEGNMEGVLVSAKRDGTNKTITVVTDARGRYEFPADRLEAGKHTLTTRAAGYDLAKRAVVEVAAGANAQADLRLIKTRDIASQLTNAEWLHSMPGSDDQKRAFLGCVTCHTLERIVRSKYDTDGFLRTFARMGLKAIPMKADSGPIGGDMSHEFIEIGRAHV